MPTRAEITDAIDARIASLWPTVTAKQEAYLASHGTYWQGLRTHSVLPSDGTPTKADRLEATPSDVKESWSDMGFDRLLPDPRAAITFDVYQSPKGHGYTCTIELEIAGKAFKRVKHVGPETWHEQPWTQNQL